MEITTTTIRISKKLKAELDKLVQSKQDTYEVIIKRLIDRKEKRTK